MKPKTYFVDLFSGIGGFALGAYWAGLRFDGHFFSEVDDYAIRIYNQRFPDAIAIGDIRGAGKGSLPEGNYITAGGFPCQDISVAGKGAGLAGQRSGLWYEYARIIRELRPEFAIMENVGALTFRGMDSVLGSLSEIGYDAEWQDIRASDVGAPHRRERIWIVAYPNSRGLERKGKNVVNPYCKRCEEQYHGIPARAGDIDRKYGRNWGGREWWEVEPSVGRVAHGIPDRVDRLKCLGNAIVPHIAAEIFRQPAFDEWRQ